MTPRSRLAAGLAIAAVSSAGIAVMAQEIGVLKATEQRATAARFAIRGASTPHDVAVVAIDDKTFDDLKQQWPFPRSRHAEAVAALHAAGARQIVYDVQFTEATSPRQDNALYAALGRAGGAVLATTEFDAASGDTNVLGGGRKLSLIGSRAAAANLPPSAGGIVDHFPYATGPLTSLAVVAAQRAGSPVTRSSFGSDGGWIDFRGPPGTIETVSFSSLIDHKVDAATLRGRVVVIGASAPSLQDVHPTPTADEPMAGPEIEANAIWTALHGLPLRDARTVLDILLVLLLAATPALLRLRLRVVPSALAGIALAAAFAVSAQVAFDYGTVLWVSAPLLAALLGTVTMIVASHLSETLLRRRTARDNDVLEARVRERTRELRETQLEILERLSRAAEGRDQETGQHVARIGRLSHRLALAIGLPEDEAEAIGHAAVAHDIGKIAVPDRILLKDGPLDEAERHEIQRHAAMGAAILSDSRSPVVRLAETIARSHHERWDGSGYPTGLRGSEIPLPARICGLCDVFDALVSERPYKKAWALDRTLGELRAKGGVHFDPMLVDSFIRIAPALFAELYSPETDCHGDSDAAPDRRTSSLLA